MGWRISGSLTVVSARHAAICSSDSGLTSGARRPAGCNSVGFIVGQYSPCSQLKVSPVVESLGHRVENGAMSMIGPGAQIGSPLPQGQLVGNYPSYDAAMVAIDKAVDAGVDPRFLSIVGRDLRSVYRLRHRPSYAAVAGRGALQGAFFGLFIGLLISMMSGGQGMAMTLGSTVVMGAVIWVLFGVIGEVLRRKQLKYAMIPSMSAVSYDIVVDNAVAGEVTSALGSQPKGPTTTPSPAAQPPAPGPAEQSQEPAEPEDTESSRGIPDLPDGRPQFGVRVDESVDQETGEDPERSEQDSSEQR